PNQGANTMNELYKKSMTATVDRLEAEKDDITGVVLTSAKKTFFAGGDLKNMMKVGPDDAQALMAELTEIKSALRRLEQL
ncbi:enoyl-CoA hydratase-related protein, partial [Streptococcus agalactiae]